jgi:Fur family zinc uptake transcriptional regulator
MAKTRESSKRKAAGRVAPTVFPGPNHDHNRCSSEAMAIAEAECLKHGRRLTPIRRHVLGVLLGSHQPLGAYEIMERLAPQGPRPAPITVYRALEFLRDNGLIHRIESRNAFVACVHNHANAEPVVFLICERCGAVGEAASVAVAATLTSAAREAGFTPKSPVIEIGGICAHCR